MTTRRISISFERGGEFTARLLEKEAPRISAAVWDALPVGGEVIHGAFSGDAFFTYVDIKPGVIENPRSTWAEAGDVGLEWHVVPVQSGGKLVPPEIIFVYSPRVMFWGTAGFGIVNVFARIEDNLKELAEVGRRLRYKGAEKVAMRRLEQSRRAGKA